MSKRIIGSILLLLIIFSFAYVSIFGISLGSLYIPEKLGLFSKDYGIRRGLDLDGGSSITFEPEIPEDYKGNVSDGINSLVGVMRKRLTNLGYTEANVFRIGSIRVGVEIPGISSPEEAIRILGQTAKLEFVDSDGELVLSGSDIVSAEPAMDKDNSYIVLLELSDDAVERFSEATKKMSEKPTGENWIAIQLDGNTITQPRVTSQINSKTCEISGVSASEAKEYAAVISAGRLPFALTAIEHRSIGPTLGVGALENSILAAGIGLLLVIILMLIVYRLPGLVSAVSLCFYVGLVCMILVVFRVNLSLPGIAGIILSIGMAVDANVVIFERIKEELNIGKSVMAAVKAGFDKAIVAVIDSNVTTIIAAVVLLIFGTGTIQGFAVTLLIGVIVSMFTAVLVTKYFLRSLVIFNVRDPWLYGLSRRKINDAKGGASNVK